MTTSQATIPIISSVSQIAGSYEAWLCDIWGVMHNGVRPFARAAQACERYRETGGTIVLLTNSPRPSGPVKQQLDEIGVPRTAYDDVVTSGDVARALMASEPVRPIYHLGPQRDRPIIDGLDIKLTDPEGADMVLCSGLFEDETETPDDYVELLQKIRDLKLPLICANPDIKVEKGDKLIYCAGALAQEYQAIGGEVIYTGKPNTPIYDLALKKLQEIKGGTLERKKILCIGDGLKTDIAGAQDASLDVLFIASAIHVDGHHEEAIVEADTIARLFENSTVLPVAAQGRLEW